MSSTKIIATIGPATSSVEALSHLAKLGIGICRLNFSHGDYSEHGERIKNIRTVNKMLGTSMAIMLDTKGPEIRTGDREIPLIVKRGDKVLFTHKTKSDDGLPVVTVDYTKIAIDAKNAKKLLIDNGALEFSVEKIVKDGVVAKALENGKIGSRRHVNIPGAKISLPSFTQKDWEDILYGIEQKVDFIASSFIRSGKDVRILKAFLAKHKSAIHVVSKIETPEAVADIDDIIAASDGIMIARGDLGVEVPFEEVPAIQTDIVWKCRRTATPVIVATQMLESMIESPMPTRAEATDIAFAAMLQADSTMLSGETTTGKFPFKAVEAMTRVLVATEKRGTPFSVPVGAPIAEEIDMPRIEQALSASVLAANLNADALIVISKHGITARAVSNCRPTVPIFSFTDNEEVQRKLMLVWGITPLCVKFYSEPDKTVADAIALVRKKSLLKKGSTVVIVSDIRTGKAPIMTIQIRTID